MARNARELVGIVKPEMDDRALEESTGQLDEAVNRASRIAPSIDSNAIRRKLEQAIPGGGLLSGAADRIGGLTGLGGVDAGGGRDGGTSTSIQTAQLERLTEIHEELEKMGASGVGGGGGGGSGLVGTTLQVLGISKAASKLRSVAGTLAGLNYGKLFRTAARRSIGTIIFSKAFGVRNIAKTGIGPLAKRMSEFFGNLGNKLGLPDLTEMQWPNLPSLSGLSWPELPNLSGLSWPSLPKLSGLSWPSLPSLTQLSWPELPTLSSLSWPDLPPGVSQLLDSSPKKGDQNGDALSSTVSRFERWSNVDIPGDGPLFGDGTSGPKSRGDVASGPRSDWQISSRRRENPAKQNRGQRVDGTFDVNLSIDNVEREVQRAVRNSDLDRVLEDAVERIVQRKFPNSIE